MEPIEMNITKVPASIWETVLTERSLEATRAQHEVDTIENDGLPQGGADKKQRIAAALPADFKHLLHLVNTNKAVQHQLHGAAHELMDAIESFNSDGEQHAPCAVIMQAECQMITLGWKLACAFLECEALRNLT